MDTAPHFNTFRDWGKDLSFYILTSGSLEAGPKHFLTISSPIIGRETGPFQAFQSSYRDKGR
jgi:hypothetical protein